MASVKSVDDEAYIDCDDDFEERFEDIVGVSYYENEPLTNITLAVKNSFTGYIDTKPLHGSQVKLPVEQQVAMHNKYDGFEGYTFYRLNLKPNRELYNLIYSNGEDVLLIGPESIRKRMITELNSSLNKLKSVGSE